MQQFAELKQNLRDHGADARRLRADLEKTTAWAHQMESDLEQRSKWALEADAHRRKFEDELMLLRRNWWTRLGRRLRFH